MHPKLILLFITPGVSDQLFSTKFKAKERLSLDSYSNFEITFIHLKDVLLC